MRFRAWQLPLILLLLAGCGGDDGVAVENAPPTITWGFDPIAVGAGRQVSLSVNVGDPDDDPLTVTFSATGGSPTQQSGAQRSMLWTAPAAVETVTVTVTVSDGQASARVEEEVVVGTRIEDLDGVVWDAANSPYVLDPPSDIASVAGVVTIPAGITILFTPEGGSIEVTNRLECQGTSANPIVIGPNSRSVRCGDGGGWWEGITVRGVIGAMVAEHTKVWQAQKNVHLFDTGSATLTHCELTCARDAGVFMASAGTLVLDSCRVTDNVTSGVEVSSLTALPVSVTIQNSRICFNEGTGIGLDLYDEVMQVPIQIRKNRIEQNFTRGIALANSVSPTIRENHFEFNGTGGLWNLEIVDYPGQPFAFPTLACSTNYWGGVFVNESDVKLTIWDQLDLGSLGTVVDVTPWRNASPDGTPDSCN